MKTENKSKPVFGVIGNHGSKIGRLGVLRESPEIFPARRALWAKAAKTAKKINARRVL
jgi:hypothetical protein